VRGGEGQAAFTEEREKKPREGEMREISVGEKLLLEPR